MPLINKEWEDNEEEDNESYGTQSSSEDAISEIQEISRDKGWLSENAILKRIPSAKIIESIRHYREIIVQLESELASRPLDYDVNNVRNVYGNVKDVGSLRFLNPEAYFTLGRPERNNKKRRTGKSNRLATKPVAVKMGTLKNFINKLILTEDEKVNLLEEWKKITNDNR